MVFQLFLQLIMQKFCHSASRTIKTLKNGVLSP
ncbi:hypothetical protein E2C01_032039 [Portunus trituberculatus]|uniref:Uncharacterized protein n=1 Tax=Portunus trituberculatus TaxID=210409 RepID=A0A5B7EV11_PORTR|nr:hypothetical protein [Portunus trituberculatus]